MKQTFKFFAVIVMVSALLNNVEAYDFSKTNNGKTLYYRIISDSTVAVTYPGSPNNYHHWEYYQNYEWRMYSKPTGSVVIPSAVTDGNYQYTVVGIDAFAFHTCSGITSITIPSTIKTVGSYAFEQNYYDESLNSVYYGGTLSEWCRIDFENLHANPLYHGNHLYINNELVTNLVIPEGVDSIKNYSFIHMYNEPTPFNRSSYLDTIILPNTLRYIGQYAFEWDYYEKHLVIPSSVEYIGQYAFSCALYGGVTLPSNIDTIRCFSFTECILPTLIIPDGVKYIEDYAFNNCRSRYIEIPASVTAMGERVFYMGYTNMANAHHLKFCGKTPPSILPNTFDGIIKYVNTDGWPPYHDTMTIEVPCQSVESYRDAANWDTVSDYICSTQVCLYEITAESNNDSLGFVVGSGVYKTDDTCTLAAISKYNVSFVGWSDGVIDNPRIISVSSDSVFMAMFSEQNTTILTDTIINKVYDTTYFTQTVHDTTIVIDTVTLTEYVPVHDTTYINVHDTTIVTDTFILTEYVPIYDTTYIDVPYAVHDTTYVNRYLHDTTIVYNYVHDTMFIIHQFHDTVTVMQVDTVVNNNYIHDTTMVTTFVHDTVIVNRYIYDSTYIDRIVHDTVLMYRYLHDTTTLTLYDTLIFNHYIHDTTILNNYIHDTTFIDNWIYDTAYVTLVDTLTVTLWDTVTQNVFIYDTTYVDNWIHDTTFVTLTDTLLVYVFVHDTTYVNNWIYDTTYIDVPYPVHDTTYVDNWIYDTIYLWQHDTTLITLTDTLTLTVTDTVTVDNFIFDTVTVIDTLWLTMFDTIYLSDTIFIHDTIYVTEQGISDATIQEAKKYASKGTIVVDGAAGKQVYLYDLTGRILATRRDEKTLIRFDVPVTGTYFIKIDDLPARKVVAIK